MKRLPVVLAAGLALLAAVVASLFLVWQRGGIPGRAAGAAPAGPLMAEAATFEFAVYYLSPPKTAPLAAVAGLLATKEFASLVSVSSPPDGKSRPQVFPRHLRDVRVESYAPPEPDLVQRFGRGLSTAQAAELATAREALVLDFGLPRARVWEGGKLACRLVSALARREQALVWDEETREIFTPAAWDERRLAPWQDPIPEISRHTVIHAYKDKDYVRAISLGMAKFALPDIVVTDFSWASNRNMGHLVNLTAQAFAEGAELRRGGRLDLRLADIRNGAVREPQLAALEKKGTGEARLVFAPGVWEDGDPRNRLLEIRFDSYPGRDNHSRQEQLLDTFFGSKDSVKYVKHDEQVKAASARARGRLPELRRAFEAGLRPGEYLLLKAPFARPDQGNEWMWVEVVAWQGKRIRGLLRNEPFEIPSLHAGQVVWIDPDDVFDYILHNPDGREEGNETGAIIDGLPGETRAQ
jgi:uncharacterized protein YegJ (DUF2314 family)